MDNRPGPLGGDDFELRLARCERQLRHERTAAAQAALLLRAKVALDDAGSLFEGTASVLRMVCEAVGGARAILWRSSDGGLRPVLDTARSEGAAVPDESAPAGLGAFLGRPHRIGDLSDHPLAAAIPPATCDMRSLLSVAIATESAPVMTMMVLSPRLDAFLRTDHLLLGRVGMLLGQTIGRAVRDLASIQGEVMSPLADRFEFACDSSLGADTVAIFKKAVAWQREVVEATEQLLAAPSPQASEAIDRALARTGRLAGVDRTYVFRLRAPDRQDNTNEWCASGVEPVIDMLQDLPDDLLVDWRPNFDLGLPVEIPVIAALPDSSVVRDILLEQGIRSLLVVPMMREGQLSGFVGYDAVSNFRRFLPHEVQLLRSVATAIGSVMDRVAAELAAARATDLVRNEKERLQTTLRALPVLLLELDAIGRFVFATAHADVPLILPPAQFLGRQPEEVLPARVAQLLRRSMQEAKAQQSSVDIEYSLEIGGTKRHFQSTTALRHAADEADGYVVVIRDLTAQHEQRRQITTLGKIADLTSNLVILADADRRIEWVNPAFEARTGWSLAEIKGRKPGDFMPHIDSAAANTLTLEDALRSGRPARGELLNMSRSGEPFWVQADIRPLLDHSGVITGFVAVETDITEIKKAHREELRDLVLAIEEANDCIVMLGQDGNITYMNISGCSLFGLVAAQCHEGQCWTTIFDPEGMAALGADMAGGPQIAGDWEGQAMGQHTDGTRIPLEVSLSRREQGGYLIIARDISERLRTEVEKAQLREELQIAQRRETIAQLASGIAHDLNNMVAVVSGTAELLAAQLPRGSALEAGVDRIRRATAVTVDLVEGLGRLGKRNFKHASLDLRRLAMQGVDLLGSARSGRHSITVALPDSAQPVWADSSELLQVITNLLLNACDSDPVNPARVRLVVDPDQSRMPSRTPDLGTTQTTKHYTLFRVEDTGPGIDDSIRARLFEPYFTTKGELGTGLGLPIIASILRDYEAALWLDSMPNGGTCATIAWPSAPGSETKISAHLEAAGPGDRDSETLAGRRILVVDDVHDVADVLAEMLESAGAEVVCLYDPQEAVLTLVEHPGHWSALITDMNMTGIDGAALAQAAAALDPPVPTVLITALPDHLGPIANRVAVVLGKPVSREGLVKAACDAIDPAMPSAGVHRAG